MDWALWLLLLRYIPHNHLLWLISLQQQALGDHMTPQPVTAGTGLQLPLAPLAPLVVVVVWGVHATVTDGSETGSAVAQNGHRPLESRPVRPVQPGPPPAGCLPHTDSQ